MREGPFAGPLDRERFDREVRILGALRQPNIVAIHDSGQSSGHFYYVMDYIPGQSLDGHVAERKPDLASTLKLFLKICDAVNTAHLRGIVHRDLKPGNVRVDAAGEPFILDFGLARGAGAWCQSVPQPVTVTGQFIGSLQWASPEQTEGIPDRVDMRTDVYSLGVILYHMLTGKFPYDVASEMWVVVDQIRRADPVRPRTLRREIDDDLETILLKCLQKDRDRRYQTSGELAKDLRHYLAGEAIEAKRDSSWYVLRKTLQRHRAAVTGAALGAVGLVVFSVVTFAMYRTAERQRLRAEQETSKAVQTVYFLRSIFESIDPDTAKGQDKTLILSALAEARKRIQRELAGQPEVAATLLTSTGHVLSQLGLYDEAESDLRRALSLRAASLDEGSGAALAETRRTLAVCLMRSRGSTEEAQRLLEAAVAEGRRARDDRPADLAESLIALGKLHYDRNDLSTAEPAFAEAMSLLSADGPAPPLALEALLSLCRLAVVRSDAPRADQILGEIRRQFPDLASETSLDAAELLYLSALADWHSGRTTGVRERLEESLRLQERLLQNPDHPNLVKTLDALGLLLAEYSSSDERDLGASMIRRAVAISRASLDAQHPERAKCLYHHGSILLQASQFAEAREALGESRDIFSRLGRDYAADYGEALGKLAQAAESDEGPDGAIALFNQALQAVAGSTEPQGRSMALLRESFGNKLMTQRRFAEAAEQHAEALRLRQRLHPNMQGEEIGRSHSNLGICLSRLGLFNDAAAHDVLATENYEYACYPGHEYTARMYACTARDLYEAGAESMAQTFALCAANAALESIHESTSDSRPSVDVSVENLAAHAQALAGSPPLTRLAVARCLEETGHFDAAELLFLSMEPATGSSACLSCFDLEAAEVERDLRLQQVSGLMATPLTRAVWESLERLYGKWGLEDRAALYRRQSGLLLPRD